MLDFLQKSKTTLESFWAILIEEEWITSSVWQIEEGKVKIVSTSSPTRWEEDILNAIDTSLSSSMQNLPEDFKDPEKTVFGLPSSWVDGGNIKEEHLQTLKKICDDLSLVPSGFVVLSEALANYYKNEEGSGITSIIIGVSDQNLEVSIFNLGNLVGVTNVARSISIEDDLTEGLVRLSGNLESLPSRVILFNQKEQELEDLKETLNNADWPKIGASKFVHTPRVEIFDPVKKIVAVTLAGGSEMGAVGGINVGNLESRSEVEEVASNVESEDKQVVNVNEEQETFIPEEVENVKLPDENLSAEDLGFVVETEEPIKPVQPELNIPKKIIPSLPKLNNFKVNVPKFNLPKLNIFKGGKFLTIGGVSIISFIVFFFLIWWFYPKAVVTVYVSPKLIEENISIDINEKAEEVEVSIEKEKNKATTGTKTVGEKAKGQVKLQNGTAFPINLSAGSSLTSATDLKFVTLSSASVSGALSPTEPGTSTINVEASSIGSEYNLNKDEVFKVSNYPKAEVDATSVESFTGGSSRQISAVSKEDQEKLYEALMEEVVDEAKNELKNKVSSDQILIEETIKTEVETEDYSNKIGDEATNINLSLKVKVTAKVISKTDLTKSSREVLESKIPEGFVLRDDQLSYEFNDSEEDNLGVRVKANLLPNLNSEEVAKKIAGKYPNIAESYLKSVAGFVKAEFRVKPLFPGKLGTLPHVAKNIDVEFSADK